jgi:uncharacterized membrane protein YtjA (UPF0391 family)
MLKWTLVFLIFSVVAGVAGVFGLSASAAGYVLGVADFEEPAHGYF